MGFCRGGDFLEFGDAGVVVVHDDRIAVGFDRVIADHCVSADDYTNITFAPAAVEVQVLGGRDTAGGLEVVSIDGVRAVSSAKAYDVLALFVPMTQPFGHGCL